MPRYPINDFYVGFDKQTAKGTEIAPRIFPKYFDGGLSIAPELANTPYVPAAGQFPSLSLVERVAPSMDLSILGTPQAAAMLIGMAMGKEQVKGTQPGTPVADSLDGAVSAGDTSITLTSATGLSEGDIIQIVSTTDEFEDTGELVAIDSISTNTLTLATALKYAHSNGDVVEKVVAPYLHKLMFADRANMPWFTAETAIAKSSVSDLTNPVIVRMVDARVAELTMSVEKGKPLMIASSLRGIDLTKQGSVTEQTHESNNPFVAFNGTYTIDEASSTTVPSFTLTITNTLDEEDFTNAVKRQDLPLLKREATLSFVSKLTDGTRFFDTYFQSGGYSAFIEALNSGDFDVDFDYGSATANRGLHLDIDNLEYLSAAPNPGAGEGSLEYQIEARVKKASGTEYFTIQVDDDQHLKYAA